MPKNSVAQMPHLDGHIRDNAVRRISKLVEHGKRWLSTREPVGGEEDGYYEIKPKR